MEESFGIIPLQRQNNQWRTLLVLHRKGHWGFPKGGAQPGELPHIVAERELQEETGLHIVRFLPLPHLIDHYHFVREGQSIEKQVTYFLAEVEGILVPQESEIVSADWVDVAEAEDRMDFLEGKELCRKLVLMLPLSGS
jgi:8-oxo-dGTP pyrophosphatase MutT (NUDIX family)